MKTLPCDICGEGFSAETFEDWMKVLQGHYMAAHADVMATYKETKTQEDGAKWMAEMKAKFDAL